MPQDESPGPPRKRKPAEVAWDKGSTRSPRVGSKPGPEVGRHIILTRKMIIIVTIAAT